MKVLKGIGVFKGIAFGKLKMHKKEHNIEKIEIPDVESEIERYEKSNDLAIKQLDVLYQQAVNKVGEKEALIFQIHQMMLQDKDYKNSILNIIKEQKTSAEYAVLETSKFFCNMFSSMQDSYIKERATDVLDVSRRLIDVLMNFDNNIKSTTSISCVIGADDLTPSETMNMSEMNAKGFVTIYGSQNSHTAILARTMNIPAVIGVGKQLKQEFDGCEIIVDGFSGTVYVSPDITTVKRLKKKKVLCENQNELLKKLKGKPNISRDGKTIEICANVGSTSDLEAVIQNDADGIGLFRSEFLYLKRNNYPSEEDQFKIYKDAIVKMNGKRVIIRTMDIGADKKASYFNLPDEQNPAMGYRAIRICLDRPEIFKTQLRAIYRASVFGRVSIMFPMIISREEVIKAKKIAASVREDLDRENIKYSNNIEIGVMIETPAAVLISDDLAKEVDFFSIGTNDLTQYSLAIDRQNNKINYMYDPYHKSILRMIKIVVDNAHKNNIWVGICGELASDESLTGVFLSLGVDELSMSSPFVLGVRKKMLEIDVDEIKDKILEDLSI